MSKIIKEVVYEVTGEFDVSPIGERRLAYTLGTDTDDMGNVLLFHPKDKSGSGSVEFASAKGGQGKSTVYVSANKSSDRGVLYLNLDPQTEKFYRQLVNEAGFKIPSVLTVDQGKEQVRPVRRVRNAP